jgi:glutamine synthetase
VKPKAVLAYCREKGIRFVDLRFPDVAGNWKHVTFPVSALTESAFESGFGQELVLRGLEHESREQMVLIPIAEANYLDPLVEQPTLVILASIHDALTREPSWLDSRAVAFRAAQYLQATGIADSVQLRACQPFTLLPPHHGELESSVPASQRFLGCGSFDPDFPFRCQLAGSASEAGVGIERHYRPQHASSEIVLSPAGLVEMCDDLLMIRYMIEQMAVQQRAPLVHVNLSCTTQWMLSRAGDAIFNGTSQQGLSDLGWHAMGGILKHATTLAAITLASPAIACDTEYPWLRRISSGDPHALCNILLGYHDPRQRTIEFRGAPSTGNPYLQMASILMAMLDGIQNKTAPETHSRDLGDVQEAKLAIANNDSGVIDFEFLYQTLLADREFLLLGNVFSEDLLDLLALYLQPGQAARASG